jgi:hypothetical protein
MIVQLRLIKFVCNLKFGQKKISTNLLTAFEWVMDTETPQQEKQWLYDLNEVREKKRLFFLNVFVQKLIRLFFRKLLVILIMSSEIMKLTWYYTVQYNNFLMMDTKISLNQHVVSCQLVMLICWNTFIFKNNVFFIHLW